VGLSWNIPQKTMEVNIVGTLNILEAVRKHAPNAKVLLIGSSEEYSVSDKPLKEEDKVLANNPYGISKIAAENIAKMYVERYKMDIICTRSFNHTGVRSIRYICTSKFLQTSCRNWKIRKISVKFMYGNLTAYRDLSSVKDVVKVYRKLLEEDNKFLVYNVGSGKSYQIEELLKYVVSLSSQDIEIIVDKDKVRKIDTPYICADNTKIKDYFDGTDIKEVIKEMYEYYKNEE